LLSYPINVRILGQEYAEKDFTGRWECDDRGIEFYFNKREHNFSTSELRQRVIAAEINKGLKDGNPT
jgi:glycerol-3-phosphate cytidylyltransferase